MKIIIAIDLNDEEVVYDNSAVPARQVEFPSPRHIGGSIAGLRDALASQGESNVRSFEVNLPWFNEDAGDIAQVIAEGTPRGSIKVNQLRNMEPLWHDVTI